MKDYKLKLCEPPIRSIQGEYPCLGSPVLIVRFAGCNLGKECSLDCDTKRSWDIRKYQEYTIQQVLSMTRPYEYLMITGGEPFLHPEVVDTLLHEWSLHSNKPVIIETNGTLIKELNSDYIVVDCDNGPYEVIVPGEMYLSISPKNIDSLQCFPTYPFYPVYGVSLKLVIGADSNTYKPFLEKFLSVVKSNEAMIYLMPEGITSYSIECNLKRVFDFADTYRINHFMVSPRLHILLGIV